MSKMNCSFPWLKNYQGPLERCGLDRDVDELIQLMKNVASHESELSKEISECYIQNCENTKWTELRASVVNSQQENTSALDYNFPFTKV